MAEKQVIQEFLAVLGFQVNQPSLKSFLSSLKMTCISAAKLGATIGGVVVAAETMVVAFAKSMEKLYYLSRVAKAPVADLKALQFGFSQVGLAGDDALDTIDELAKRIRYEPGKLALMRALGIDTKDQNPVVLFKQLMLKLRELNKEGAGFIAVQWAEAFGISEKVYSRLMLPGAIEALGKSQVKVSRVFKALGIDQEQAARASRDFMNELRELWLIVETLGTKLSIQLMPYLKQFNQAVLQFANDFVNSGLSVAIDNQLAKLGSWGEALKRVKDWAMPVLRALGKAMSDFADDFAKFGLSTAIDNALKKMGTIGKVMQALKDVIDILPVVPDVIAQLMSDMFGPGENRTVDPTGKGNFGVKDDRPKPGTFGYLGNFIKDLAGATGTTLFGAQSQTFAPKAPWWSSLDPGPLLTAPGKEQSVVLHQKTDIHIGATDPAAAGRAVATEQNRVNSDMVRHVASVPR